MKNPSAVHRFAALLLLLALSLFSISAHTAVQAIIDTDESGRRRFTHRYIHGVILDDAKFQISCRWNGMERSYSHPRLLRNRVEHRGILAGGASKGLRLRRERRGWNRVMIKDEPEDTYYESRQRLMELTLYMNATVKEYYGRDSSRTLIMGGSNGGHHTKWMLEDFPDLFDGGIAGYGFNSQVSQWGSYRDGDPQL